jgi:hypothetical protein
MDHTKYTRRSLLKTLGAGAAASGFLSLIPPLEADAVAAGGPQKRLLLLWSPMGVNRGVNQNWRPTGTDGNLTLHPSCKPLEPLRDRLIWLTGCWLHIDLRRAGADGSKGHTAVSALLLTGRPNIRGPGGTMGAGESLDYTVGQKIGAGTRHPSLQFSLNTHPNSEIYHATFRARGERITPESSPNAAFDRLFAGRTGGAGAGGVAGYVDRKKSILDNTAREIAALRTRVSSWDLHRIEQHHQALREIERNLVNLPGTGNQAGVAAACGGLKEIPKTGAPPGRGGTTEQYHALPQASDAFNKIIPEVLACDLSRSIMYQWSSWKTKYLWIGGHTEEAHTYSHNDMRKYGECVTWHYKEAMKIFTALDAVKEVDGSTLLDNTLCVFVSEFSAGGPSHVPTNMPTLFVGGEKVAPGKRHRLIDFGEMGRSHVDYLQSIARIFGIPQFGDQRFTRGPIPGLFSA